MNQNSHTRMCPMESFVQILKKYHLWSLCLGMLWSSACPLNLFSVAIKICENSLNNSLVDHHGKSGL